MNTKQKICAVITGLSLTFAISCLAAYVASGRPDFHGYALAATLTAFVFGVGAWASGLAPRMGADAFDPE